MHCPDCGASTEFGPVPVFACSACGGVAVTVTSGEEFLVDNGSLYPALERLLLREWIAAEWKTSPNGRRAKYYGLTPLGRTQLVTATSKWNRFVEAMGRILAPEG